MPALPSKMVRGMKIQHYYALSLMYISMLNSTDFDWWSHVLNLGSSYLWPSPTCMVCCKVLNPLVTGTVYCPKETLPVDSQCMWLVCKHVLTAESELVWMKRKLFHMINRPTKSGQFFGGYSIKESGFRYIVNSNLDSVKKCILLTNLNPHSNSVNPAWISFHLWRDIGDEC